MTLVVKNLGKSFKQNPLWKSVSFELSTGQTLAILGPSGSGKTTLLKVIAGMTKPDEGLVEFGKPKKVIYLNQDPLLFPHLSVWENIAFGLKAQKFPKDQIAQKVNFLVEKLEISHLADSATTNLSGGEKQRVAFGRAIVIQPDLLLLDEPFSALDAFTRKKLQLLFNGLKNTFRISSILVTHDLREAMTIGDQWGYLKDGRFKYYTQIQDFVSDRDTGALEEIEYWKKLTS
jgi:ABC-type sugar transport system ATPase subunit